MTWKHLQSRRIAAYCLNAICREHHLGSKVHTFLGDQFEDWDLRSDWEIFALIDKEVVAEVYLTENNAAVIIPSWWALIRRNHLGDFEPHDHGIETENRINPVTQLKYDDGDFVMTFRTEDIPGFNLPEANLPRHIGGRRPKVIASR